MMEERPEIVFFDVETTVPTKPGQGFAILEFGAILVCPRKLVELRNYSTLVKPADLSHISSLSVRCNGITKEAVVVAPTFAEIADVVYDLLHGRIWAGHNILKFDCARIREAFAEINRPSPEPKGAIDSLVLLRQKFGRRAGDMKMASLATYFGLGQQTHRSLDDVRMNLEVLKYCATVLFLESSLPDVFAENSWVSPNAITRSRRNGKSSPENTGQNESSPSSSANAVICSAESSTTPSSGKNHPILSLVMPPSEDAASSLIDSNSVTVDPFDLSILCDEMENTHHDEDTMEEEKSSLASEESSTSIAHENPHRSDNFLEPDDISIPSISATLVRSYPGHRKVQIVHQGSELQLRCKYLKVRFGISTKFFDNTGRPKLNFVVDLPPSLRMVLEKTDSLAKELSIDSGSSSDWHPIVNKKPGFYNYPTIRLHIPIIADGETSRLVTEIFEKDDTGTRKVVFSGVDVVELDSLLSPGNLVDASFSLDSYDYQQNAGVRLVAKKTDGSFKHIDRYASFKLIPLTS